MLLLTIVSFSFVCLFLSPNDCRRYAYALDNGTIGVYSLSSRIWRVKSKHKPTALESFDVTADGVPEVVSGWSDGALNVRCVGTGEVVCKDTFEGGAGIAGIVKSDYRCDGNESLVVCGADGEVRGYLPAARDQTNEVVDDKKDVKAIERLNEKKKRMMMELQNLEASVVQIDRTKAATTKGTAGGQGSVPQGSIPQGTEVSRELVVNFANKCCELSLSVTSDTGLTDGSTECCIMSVIVVDAEGGVLEDDAVIETFKEPRGRCKIGLNPKRNVQAKVS